MSKFNKSYRIRTEIGKDTSLHIKLDRDYDVLELMSLKIDQINDYKLHTANYGVIAGRVLANDAFGIPNAKVSVFIGKNDNDNDIVKSVLYPYNSTYTKNSDGIKYNLLPNEQLNDCHTIIGTFPEKQYMLNNDSLLEVFDEYYKYTTRTNNAGDYMIFGVPIGNQTIHVDIDLSDIGILSQKPRDMVYKGYNIEQFENPNKFKYSTNLESLTQVISQDSVTDVIPFWGDESESTIGITRCDINIQYKFEPTCVFLGSVVSDTSSNAISKKCIPTPGMGAMDEITTGSGTIEMIRKTPNGNVEEFQIKGTQLINGDGVWCYQIPMNLDYIMTDEYGNTVPTNDPEKGIPTRTRVRFRISMQDFDSDSVNKFRCKMLVPHNPNIYNEYDCENEIDYNFGDNTKDSSYRDLFWNCVYSVKSYIPRIQKGSNWKNEKFTGFKRVNYYGDKNPIPYNNIRIKIPFMYMILCILIKMFIKIVSIINWVYYLIAGFVIDNDNNDRKENPNYNRPSYNTLSGELCGEHLENIAYIPGVDLSKHKDNCGNDGKWCLARRTLLGYALLKHYRDVSGDKIDGEINEETFKPGADETEYYDEKSVDRINSDAKNDNQDPNKTSKYSIKLNENKIILNGISFTSNVDNLIACIEMNLAKEYKVIQFDFYNDWINGLIYIPRWERNITKKRTFIFKKLTIGGKVKACNEEYKSKKRNLVQQCGVQYKLNGHDIANGTKNGCNDNNNKLQCHKDKSVRLTHEIFKENGLVKSKKTIKNQFVYYFKPCEINNKNVRLFSTDIILLGSLDKYNKMGIPSNLEELVSSSYQMPPNIALTDSEIEGDEYNIKNKNTITLIFEGGALGGSNNLRIKQVSGDTTSIEAIEETGNYTEISGINWNYSGPLQKYNLIETDDEKLNEYRSRIFTPGGHFLGLSCRNSETTIKTCVNLTRICEFGVWMSQRQSFDIPSTGSENKLNVINIIPSGIISKDEISGSDYRVSFASMNQNRLRTIKDNKNNYLKYDFKYVHPNGFAGELVSFVYGSVKNTNRFITSGITEKEVKFDDNDFVSPTISGGSEIEETIIMRTGEYCDYEYYKFRFGIDNLTDNEKKKRFLIYGKNGNIELVSFPMYNNSFYFYFGLHDGRTALDEFKRIYYATCENNNLSDNDETSNIDTANYLTIEILENNTSIKFGYFDNESEDKIISYSYNCETWKDLSAEGLTNVKKDTKIYFKADNLTNFNTNGIGIFKINNKFNLSGNIMSLVFGDDAKDKKSLSGKPNYFKNLFKECKVVNVSEKFLPATELANNCYNYMFFECTSLANAPELPATTLADYCYYNMFHGCTSLNYIKMLATDISADSCLDGWVSVVSSTGTFVKSKDATWDESGVIPEGWTVETA